MDLDPLAAKAAAEHNRFLDEHIPPPTWAKRPDQLCIYAASFDSLDIMEKVMRHFYLRALIEERMGSQTDWNAVDSLMLKALAAAEKVARYRHAQLSAIKLAGDINANAKMTDNACLVR